MAQRPLRALAVVLLLALGFHLLSTPTASNVWRHYPSVPKGVTLEGECPELSAIESVTYDARANTLLFNGTILYPNPLSRAEFTSIFQALQKDDRFGMSITDLRRQSIIAYGALSTRDPIMKTLLDTDLFLSAVVFARPNHLGRAELPEKYVPRAVGNRTRQTVCHFNIEAYRFQLSAPNSQGVRTLQSTDRSLDITLVPVSPHPLGNGGYQPDIERLQNNDFDPEDVANRDHMAQHAEWYLKHPRVRQSVTYGEVAAIVRTILKNKTVTAELSTQLRGR